MKEYTVSEAFALLKQNKITSHEESVRHWLRQGVIHGIQPEFRQEGWRIREDDLYAFIRTRLPEDIATDSSYTTNDAQKKEVIGAEMWWEMARKYLFEGAMEPKRMQIKASAEHKRYSSSFEKYAWNIISQHKMGYAKPHIPYLLDAFLFNGQRIRMDDHYEGRNEAFFMPCWNIFEKKKQKEGDSMELRVGDVWYGKYEGIRATIDDVTARYIQAALTPPLYQKGVPLYGKPLGKRRFTHNFTVQKQITIFDVLDDE